ncbi:MAG: hypothetical protein ACMG6S_01755 [Byssovorax sp.]
MRSRDLLTAALVVFMAACGARSTLRVSSEGATGSGGSGPGGAGAGGSGPATGPGTSGVGSSTGSSTGGSVNVVCPALQMLEPLVELPALADLRAAHDPLLQRLGQGDVLALMRREAVEGPVGGGLSSVSQVRLAPWESWPPVFEAPLLTLSDSWNVPFVSSVEPLGTFALGVEPFPKNNPSGCDLAAFYGLSPEAPPGPSALALKLDGTCDDRPIAVATAGNGTHFVANDVAFGSSIHPVRSLVAHVLDASGSKIASMDLACATTRFVGDVLSDETGFLFVHARSDSQSCFETELHDPARRLVLQRFQGTKQESSVIHEGVDDLVYTRLLPRNGGSWVLYRESGASAVVQPPGMAMRLEAGSPSGDAFPVTSSDTNSMAAAAFGDGFVVAFVDSIDPSAPNIFVRVYDGSGTLSSEVSFGTNGAWLLGDRLTLVASPSARSFLVGWIGAKEPFGSETFLRRFDCIPHE